MEAGKAYTMTTVCFTAKNIYYPKGGGHFWVPLNWELGLLALGCDVIWLEPIYTRRHRSRKRRR
jgi:hypothetical protein